MDLNLTNKVAVVFAASKGLGKAAALYLAAEGCKVAICSRNEHNLKQAQAELQKSSGSEVLTHVVDVGKKSDIDNFIQMIVDKWQKIDILVTNGGGPPVKPFMDTDDEEWHTWFENTFMSVVRSIKAVIPSMQKNKSGRIINITSVSVKAPLENLIYSNSLRLGVVGLAKTLAAELGPYGITVNNVAPGYHLTEGLERIIRTKVDMGFKREEVLEQWTEKIPLRRIGLPDDLAGLITFLASERSSYITGATIQVEGGMYSGVL
ncbi:MAG: SDR family oxidoreductase [Calditrichaceae bacterium]|nr:SDR family oxidoreductase [Calditrichaceae bacterium]HES59092.1 SDR family oxidoreductase [Caldithrix sp.]